jgi:uncharacterized protein (UPF0333 family)
MRGRLRGQISVEYLIIIAVAIGILVPGVLFFYTYSQSSTSSSTNSRMNEIGLRVVATVQSTYALGVGARETVEFVMPAEVTRAYVNSTELVFVYDTGFGPSETVFFSNINMTGASPDGNISIPHPGVTRYRISAQGQTVLINETA